MQRQLSMNLPYLHFEQSERNENILFNVRSLPLSAKDLHCAEP